ncbi:MAG TPA: hypothetical protein EYQ26_17205 [Rhodospirillales bacterium]|nr:hypothetical protein [Rhodospirillales bacterium]
MERDLQNSRPFNMHLVCTHTGAADLMDQIIQQYFPDDKSKTLNKNLGVLLLDLYATWYEDPDSCLAVYMSQRFYKAKSRYNALSISHQIIDVIRVLNDAGLIGLFKGQQSTIKGKPGRLTRIWADPPLIKLFEDVSFSMKDIHQIENKETIILRDEEKNDMEYEDTPDTRRMRAVVEAYNNLLDRTFIDIPELKTAVLEATDGSSVRVSQQNKSVSRIFSRSSFDLGGRYYNAWWHLISSFWREKILINDSPTVEDDYSGMLIAQLYAAQNKQMEGDAYSLGLEEEHPFDRTILKKIILLAINSENLTSAVKDASYHIRKEWKDVVFTNKQVKEVIEFFKARHPLIADQIASDAGIRLMRQDSDIAEIIISQFTEEDIPVLTIHDSFIVPWGQEDKLRERMYAAFEKVTGAKITKITRDGIDMTTFDRERYRSPSHRADVINQLNPFRTDGYKERMRKFEKSN